MTLVALGITYPQQAVFDCTDSRTNQHVAVLSRLLLSNVLPQIPRREGYYRELDDADQEDNTGA